jgi:hypothetical protein
MCSDTEPERLAAAWHDAAGEEHAMDSSCWCCCIECDLQNPHYEAAQATLKQWAKAKREQT